MEGGRSEGRRREEREWRREVRGQEGGLGEGRKEKEEKHKHSLHASFPTFDGVLHDLPAQLAGDRGAGLHGGAAVDLDLGGGGGGGGRGRGIKRSTITS